MIRLGAYSVEEGYSEAVKRLRGGYSALSRGDVTSLLDMADEEIAVWDDPFVPEALYEGTGLQALESVFRAHDDLDGLNLTPEEFVDDRNQRLLEPNTEEQVVAIYRIRGKGLLGRVDSHGYHVISMRDAKIVALRRCINRYAVF